MLYGVSTKNMLSNLSIYLHNTIHVKRCKSITNLCNLVCKVQNQVFALFVSVR